MAAYFTSEHFKLLNRWKGQKRDDSNPEQNRAYEELKAAYEITESWAGRLKNEIFPVGRVAIRKRPTNQANKFAPYNWARIYPSAESPKELAYTVGIDADLGFVVKIDTVGLDDADPTRLKYLAIRDSGSTSTVVATLSSLEGLSKTIDELVAWSVDAIRSFRLGYEDVVKQLELRAELSDEDLLKHFDGKPAFQTFRASWSAKDRALFCRLARAVHAAGLDWWHMGKNIQVRFGRKNPGSERAVAVLGIVRGVQERKISWNRPLGPVGKLHRSPLDEDVVASIETALSTQRGSLGEWMALETERPGLWPDELRDDPSEADEDSDEDVTVDLDDVMQPVNRIYYGPPGTGKTYELSKLLKREYSQATTSVPVSEWRDQFIAHNTAGMTWWEGAAAALYDLGGTADVDQLLAHPFVKAIAAAKTGNKTIRNTIWGALQHHTIEESKTVKVSKRMSPAIFEKLPGAAWTFAGEWEEVGGELRKFVEEYRGGPEAGESIERYTFVTFHQSYGYEDFVEGLRPVLGGDGGAGEIQYEIRSGAFKELCRAARVAPNQRYAIVIDEINRGNISKILGELITLIEADKREGAENAVSLTLPYSGELFSVPRNVDIIGTMNTADRSLALLDTALRRRFEFVPLLPDARDDMGAPLAGLRVSAGEQVINVPRMLEAINQRIEALYDRDHCIGHAYFMPLAKVPDGDERLVALQQIFSTRILPLLQEYFFEDWQKIRLVLADNQKSIAAQFVAESQDHEDDLARLFGGDHGLNSYATKRRYAVQDAAFSNPDAYMGIYKTLFT